MKKYLNKVNFKYIVPLITVFIFAISCEDSNLRDGIREVTFKPTATSTLVNVGSTITYIDSSVNVSSRAWSFDGGSISSSDQEIVDVIYNEAGIFGTELEVTSNDGTTTSNIFNVEIFPRVTSEFNASANAAQIGSVISFSNVSQNTASAFEDLEAERDDSFFWEFEGGVPSTSSEKDPVVQYPNTGVFDVKLTVWRRAPLDSMVTVKTDFVNIVDVEVISPAEVNLVDLGSKIAITYGTALASIDASKFDLLVDDAPAGFTIAVDGTDPNTYLLTLDTPITEGQTIVLNYVGGGDFAATGELLAPIVDLAVTNSVVNLFVKGDFEGVTTNEYDVNNGFLGSNAADISADLVDGVGADGSRALVFTATAATAGSRRTLFGDKNNADVQLIEPIEQGADYLVKALIKYTGTVPEQVRFSMVGFTFDNVIVNAPFDISGLVEGEWLEVEASFTAPGNNKPQSYALPNVTVGAGASTVSWDNVKVYKK